MEEPRPLTLFFIGGRIARFSFYSLYIQSNHNYFMKALVVDVSPVLQEIPIPSPKPGQVLIKVDSAPITQLDKLFLQSKCPCSKPLRNAIPGFEGSGVVEQNGGGLLGYKLRGNRVAFFTEHQYGSYAQYAIAEAVHCVELPKSVSLAEAACSFVNPLSVVCMAECGAKGVVSTASTCHMGRMIMRYCQSKGMHVINIVRSESGEKLLKEEGAMIILNQNEPQFEERLRLMAQTYGCHVLLDGVGGAFCGKILSLMPPGSKAIVYGDLGGSEVDGLAGSDLIYENKSVRGFSLFEELKNRNFLQLQLLYSEVMQHIKGAFRTLPQVVYQLGEWEKAVSSRERVILRIQ